MIDQAARPIPAELLERFGAVRCSEHGCPMWINPYLLRDGRCQRHLREALRERRERVGSMPHGREERGRDRRRRRHPS